MNILNNQYTIHCNVPSEIKDKLKKLQSFYSEKYGQRANLASAVCLSIENAYKLAFDAKERNKGVKKEVNTPSKELPSGSFSDISLLIKEKLIETSNAEEGWISTQDIAEYLGKNIPSRSLGMVLRNLGFEAKKIKKTRGWLARKATQNN